MASTKAQLELTGLERFSHLEDKIYRVVEAFKAIQKENETLRAENGSLRAELDAIKAKEDSASDTLASLQKEREELRERVEKALNLLATLETR
ncbi:MAG: cell division protein ZapB [Acidobacteria bacterium]|nr:cell division protein ZapB [Acidobacteriota bacterium]